jgi:hypothetical protein
MNGTLFTADRYTIRRKVLKIFGASFHVLTEEGTVIGFSKQAAFRLREDIRVYASEAMQEELVAIRARQIVDFSAAYDVVDSVAGRKVGAARRKGFSSILRDAWEILDENDRPIATVREDSTALALVRRFLVNLIPQSFHMRGPDGTDYATIKQRFNPFIYKLDVTNEPGSPVDKRLVFAAAVLIAAVEGRQN